VGTKAFAAAAALSAAVLLAAGCGGESEPSAEASQWASDVCTSISQWKTDVEGIAEQATEQVTSGTASRETIQSAIDDGLQASRELASELKALGAPDTPEGEEARQSLQTFADRVESSVNDVEQALDDLPDNPTVAQIIQSLSGLATSLQADVQAGQQVIVDLQEAGSDLRQAFEESPSCDELREPQDS
jgi:hypothetical protein